MLIPELAQGRGDQETNGNAADAKTPGGSAPAASIRVSTKGLGFLCCGLGNKEDGGQENGPASAKGDGAASGNKRGAILLATFIHIPYLLPSDLEFSFPFNCDTVCIFVKVFS